MSTSRYEPPDVVAHDDEDVRLARLRVRRARDEQDVLREAAELLGRQRAPGQSLVHVARVDAGDAHWARRARGDRRDQDDCARDPSARGRLTTDSGRLRPRLSLDDVAALIERAAGSLHR
jgi:uncharacterized protein (DUF1778 family)